MNINSKIISVIYFMSLFTACGGGIISDIPEKPDSTKKFIFYLHGSAEEEKGTTAKFEAVVGAIAQGSATVISEVRGETYPNDYAKKIRAQVDDLIAKGVSPKNITISGFSKGSIIALASAVVIQEPEVNYVLLAGCSGFLNYKYDVDLKQAAGRILSIYDSEDEEFGSCAGIIKPNDKLILEEIELNSGKGHKLFRIPKDKFIEQWRDPLLEWAGA